MNLENYLQSKGAEVAPFEPLRAKRICARLKPHLHLPTHIIHILGTNGKGSTGRFITFGLLQNQKSVLHFTSPHLFCFNERFYRNGANVDYSMLERAHKFLQRFDFINEASYFEYATFLALALAQDCEFLVLEAGLGGEFDSTSALDSELSFFTPIGLDHKEFLGENIESVAGSKLRAMGQNVILAKQEFPQNVKIAKTIATESSARLFCLSTMRDAKEFIENLRAFDELFKKQDSLCESICTPTHTPAQVFESLKAYCARNEYAPFLEQNLFGALFALRFFGLDFDFSTLKKLDLRARCEKIAPNILLDVGHNVECAKALKMAIEKFFKGKKPILVYNTYLDKDASTIIKLLKPLISEVAIFRIEGNPRIMPLGDLEKILNKLEVSFRYFDFADLREEQYYVVFGSFSVAEGFLKQRDSKQTLKSEGF
ncbi:bifunctional folylpolyglutamate synthase/dihydrofolate synthase [Helicobacter himalayensis]|uniref:bifunctional folylpolyglutamate synthase/dihydrofolate synthase n=1 Tax=Helicobacter himalayensis TaxID=1591088 RepID=UPI003D6FD9EB